jgi:hypothetical protein
MDDREQIREQIRERITRELRERVSELLGELKEADEKGDKKEADRVVDELVQLVETHWPWMIGKGKINPVQEAIWALRLAKSPGFLEAIRSLLRELLIGPERIGPSHREIKEQTRRQKWNYYWQHRKEMKEFRERLWKISNALESKYEELCQVVVQAEATSEKGFPQDLLSPFSQRELAAQAVQICVSKNLNPKDGLDHCSEEVNILTDISAFYAAIRNLLPHVKNYELFSQIGKLSQEIGALTEEFTQVLKEMEQAGFERTPR